MCYPLKLRTGRSRDRTWVWSENFHTCPNRPWAPPKLPYNGYCAFSGISGRGGVITVYSHLVPTLKKSTTALLLQLWAFAACSWMKFDLTLTFVNHIHFKDYCHIIMYRTQEWLYRSCYVAPLELCCTSRVMLHRSSYVAPLELCCTSRVMLHHSSYVAPLELCCTSRVMLHLSSYVAPLELCCTSRVMLHFSSYVAPLELCCTSRVMLHHSVIRSCAVADTQKFQQNYRI